MLCIALPSLRCTGIVLLIIDLIPDWSRHQIPQRLIAFF